MTYVLLIQFLGGRLFRIEGVKNYRWDGEGGCLTVEKNGYNMFFNTTNVDWVAREYCIEDSLEDYLGDED